MTQLHKKETKHYIRFRNTKIKMLFVDIRLEKWGTLTPNG